MTPTPRTDAFAQSGKAHYMALNFARQLEREIIELNERLIDLLAAFDGNAHRKPKSQENLDDPNEQTFTRM